MLHRLAGPIAAIRAIARPAGSDLAYLPAELQRLTADSLRVAAVDTPRAALGARLPLAPVSQACPDDPRQVWRAGRDALKGAAEPPPLLARGSLSHAAADEPWWPPAVESLRRNAAAERFVCADSVPSEPAWCEDIEDAPCRSERRAFVGSEASFASTYRAFRGTFRRWTPRAFAGWGRGWSRGRPWRRRGWTRRHRSGEPCGWTRRSGRRLGPRGQLPAAAGGQPMHAVTHPLEPPVHVPVEQVEGFGVVEGLALGFEVALDGKVKSDCPWPFAEQGVGRKETPTWGASLFRSARSRSAAPRPAARCGWRPGRSPALGRARPACRARPA